MSPGTDAQDPQPRSRGATLALTGIVLIGVAIWAVVLLPGPSEADRREGGPPLFSATEDFLNEPATLTGRVTRRYGREAFAIAVGDGRQAIVLPAETGGERPSGTVRVTGSVRRVGVDLRPIIGGDISVRRGDPALEDATVEPIPN